MSVTGGNDWSYYYDICAHAGNVYGFAFLFFTFFFVFSLTNILTSVFVEKVRQKCVWSIVFLLYSKV
eukprot:13023293-Heterocapsa_arctica.AAC.1